MRMRVRKCFHELKCPKLMESEINGKKAYVIFEEALVSKKPV